MQVRCFYLPALILSASAALTLANPPTSQNILLNGLAVAYILEVDDMLMMLTGDEQVVDALEAMENDPLDDRGEALQRWVLSTLDNVYHAFRFAIFIYAVLETESMMQMLPDSSMEREGGLPCTDIVNALRDPQFYLIAFWASVLSSFTSCCLSCWQHRHNRREVVKGIIRLCSVPIFWFCFFLLLNSGAFSVLAK